MRPGLLLGVAGGLCLLSIMLLSVYMVAAETSPNRQGWLRHADRWCKPTMLTLLPVGIVLIMAGLVIDVATS